MVSHLQMLSYPFPKIIEIRSDKRMLVVERAIGEPGYDNDWRMHLFSYCKNIAKRAFQSCSTRKTTSSRSVARKIGIDEYWAVPQHGDLHCENVLRRNREDFAFIDYDMIGVWPLFFDAFSIVLSPKNTTSSFDENIANLNYLVQNASDVFDSFFLGGNTTSLKLLDRYLSLFFLARFDWLMNTAKISHSTYKAEIAYRVAPFLGAACLDKLPLTRSAIQIMCEMTKHPRIAPALI